MRIATGEIPNEYNPQDDGKNQAAVELGRRGGAARAKSLPAAKRIHIAMSVVPRGVSA
jgi:hypothetical protein